MKREDFYFDSRDGETRIHAVKWIPEKKPRCVVQIVHGMAEYASRYEGLAEALTAEGIVVAGATCPPVHRCNRSAPADPDRW